MTAQEDRRAARRREVAAACDCAANALWAVQPRNVSSSPEAALARRLLDKIKSDPAVMAAVVRALR